MLAQVLELIRRFPFIVGCTAVALIALAANLWVLDTAQTYDQELEDITRQGAEVFELIATRSLLERELDLAKLAVNRTEDNLVVEDNLAENLWYFYSIEGRTQTRLSELRQVNSPAPGPDARYRLIPYELRVTGDFVHVAQFLHQIETGPRLLRLADFSMSRQPGPNNQVAMELHLQLLGRK